MSGQTENKKGTPSKSTSAAGVAFTILGGCFWGLSGSCGEYLFTYKGVTSSWLVPVRLLLAGLAMLAWFLIRDRGKAFRIWKHGRDAVGVLLYGLGGLMLCQYTYFTTIQLSNAGTATVIQYLSPVLIVILVCFMEKRFPRPVEVIALALAVSGIFLIATHGNIRQLVISKEALVMGLLSAVAVVFYNIQPRRLMTRYSSAYLLAWGMTVGGIVLSLIFRPWEHKLNLDAGFLLAMAAILFLGTIVSFTLYMQGMKMIGPVRASLYACVEPIAATLLSAVWLKVPFAPIDFVGFAMIIATILILGYSDLKKSGEG